MSFSDGFQAGASVGNQIQQRLLAKELRKLEDARYNDEREYRRNRDQIADTRYGEEREYRRGRDTVADTRYGEERQYRIGRDTVADARDARDFSARRGDRIMDDLRQSLQSARDNRRLAAEIQKINAQSEYYRNGGGLGASRAAMGYDEYGPDGELVKRRVPVGMGTGAPTAAEDGDPELAAIEARIRQLQTENGQQRVAMAGGDNRTGFLNLKSRQGIIDANTRELANLRRQSPQAPQAQLSPQDQQALQWAQANPNDPRAAAILQRLGSR